MSDTNGLQIEFEWQDPGDARGEELRATWASLSVFIDNRPVTELSDTKTKSIRNSIVLPLFPLAEWIADHWWFLRAEVDRPDGTNPLEFDRRHNIRWAREGFVLPALQFVPTGKDVSARWDPSEIPDAGIRFLSSGRAVLDGREVAESLRGLVNAVIARLEESGVTGTTLREQWLAIENADESEGEFCQASARLGIDPDTWSKIGLPRKLSTRPRRFERNCATISFLWRTSTN